MENNDPGEYHFIIENAQPRRDEFNQVINPADNLTQTNFTMEDYLDSKHLRKVLIAGLQWEENRSPSMLECDAYMKSLEIN